MKADTKTKIIESTLLAIVNILAIKDTSNKDESLIDLHGEILERFHEVSRQDQDIIRSHLDDLKKYKKNSLFITE